MKIFHNRSENAKEIRLKCLGSQETQVWRPKQFEIKRIFFQRCIVWNGRNYERLLISQLFKVASPLLWVFFAVYHSAWSLISVYLIFKCFEHFAQKLRQLRDGLILFSPTHLCCLILARSEIFWHSSQYQMISCRINKESPITFWNSAIKLIHISAIFSQN